MASLPLHPRLARLVVAGEELGIPRLARLASVLLEAGDLAARHTLERKESIGEPLESDLLPRLDRFHEAEAVRFESGALRAAGLDGAAVHHAQRAFQQLCRNSARARAEPGDAEIRLRRALLRAYPDRVGKLNGTTLALVGGGGAKLDPCSRVRRAELLVALEADQAATGGQVRVRTASAIEADWLVEDFPDALSERLELRWNPNHSRVERIEGLFYEDLCFDEQRRAAKPGEPGVAEVLLQALDGTGLVGCEGLLDRASFLKRIRPGIGIPDRDGLAAAVLGHAAAHAAGLADLESTDWSWALRELVGETAFKLLERLAPEQIALPRRKVQVHYDGETPWIASRLQDFLGLREGPRIGGGEIPLVLHLLAPNQRAVQVTTDLGGFWQRAYKELRPQLSRRYPMAGGSAASGLSAACPAMRAGAVLGLGFPRHLQRDLVEQVPHPVAFLAVVAGIAAGESVGLHAFAARVLDVEHQFVHHPRDLVPQRAVGNLPQGEDDAPLFGSERRGDGFLRHGGPRRQYGVRQPLEARASLAAFQPASKAASLSGIRLAFSCRA
jgi:ATP-dependent helicase HrpB